MTQKLKIAILVLNYNGQRFLQSVLRDLDFAKLDPELDVIVIDNASADRSRSVVSDSFPWVGWIANQHNYGWGDGYNKGIAQLPNSHQYTHYLFLNNDTYPSQQWMRKLKGAVIAADQSVGEIGCRTVFADRLIKESPLLFQDLASCRALKYAPLSHNDKHFQHMRSGSAGHGVIAKVLETPPAPFDITLHEEKAYFFQVYNPSSLAVSCSPPQGFGVSQHHLMQHSPCYVLRPNTAESTSIKVPARGRALFARVLESSDQGHLLIQNSGVGLHRNYSGFDLHAYESIDIEQNWSELRGVCGVAKLVKRQVFEELGGFDPTYFMYYEDLDFSLRLQAKGYRSILVPEAVLVHNHAGSSNASSLFFKRQVAWSQLYFFQKHAPFWRRLQAQVSYRLQSLFESMSGTYRPARTHTYALEQYALMAKLNERGLQR